MGYVICVGTVGSGLWVSYDAGGKFRHIQRGVEPESNCRALAVDPHRPGRILASLDGVGLFCSEDNGGNWERLGTPFDRPIWSIGVDPGDPERLFVGTRPGIHRSTDGGDTFHELDTSIPERCEIGVPRTTNVVVDPADSSTVWASVEIGGLHRSRDGGDTWSALAPLGPSPFHDDVHGFALRRTEAGTRLLATSPFGVARSDDDGASWAWHEFDPFPGAKLEVAYSRCVRAPWDDETVVVCVGDYIPGAIGAVEVSRDGGETWKRADLPAVPNSTMYWLAVHEELPGVVVASSVFGQLFVSEDHAASWRKLDRELGEIRALSLTPG
jgi:photosystem II stability/assembly factor-like uncharacterized protein